MKSKASLLPPKLGQRGQPPLIESQHHYCVAEPRTELRHSHPTASRSAAQTPGLQLSPLPRPLRSDKAFTLRRAGAAGPGGGCPAVGQRGKRRNEARRAQRNMEVRERPLPSRCCRLRAHGYFLPPLEP